MTSLDLWKHLLHDRGLPSVQGKATVPSRLGEELETNPFLRPSSAAIRAALGTDT